MPYWLLHKPFKEFRPVCICLSQKSAAMLAFLSLVKHCKMTQLLPDHVWPSCVLPNCFSYADFNFVLIIPMLLILCSFTPWMYPRENTVSFCMVFNLTNGIILFFCYDFFSWYYILTKSESLGNRVKCQYFLRLSGWFHMPPRVYTE